MRIRNDPTLIHINKESKTNLEGHIGQPERNLHTVSRLSFFGDGLLDLASLDRDLALASSLQPSEQAIGNVLLR